MLSKISKGAKTDSKSNNEKIFPVRLTKIYIIEIMKRFIFNLIFKVFWNKRVSPQEEANIALTKVLTISSY